MATRTRSKANKKPDPASKGAAPSGQAQREMQLLSAAVETSPDCVVIADLAGTVMCANKAAQKMARVSAKDVAGKDIRSLFPEVTLLDDAVQEVLDRGYSQGESKSVHPDGTVSWTSYSNSLIRDEEGSPLGMLAILSDTTQSNEAREQLQVTEERFRTIFENSAVAITVTDENEDIVSWNKFAEVLLGMNKDDLHMRPVRSLYPAAEWRRIRSQNIRQKGMQHHFETRVVKKNQEIIDVDLSLSVLKGPDGNVSGSIGIMADITKRKKAQEQLQLAEEKYRTIFENSAVAITVTDENENIISWNKFAEVLLGMNKDDLHMRPVRSLYPEAEWRRIRSQNIRQKGIHHHFETRIVRKNQEIVDVDLCLSVLKAPDGNVSGSIGIMADITERKKAEDALRRSEEKLKAYLESSPDAIYSMDLKGTFLYGNRAAERLIGYPKEELLGKSFLELDLLAPEYLPRTLELLELNAAGKPTGPDEGELIRKDGSRVFVEICTYPIGQGKRIEVIGIARDITERKNAEAEKQRIEQQLQLAGRLAAVGELAAGVAHELNNPLAAIQGFAQFLESKQDLDESIRRDVETIYQEAQRATRITSNLLSFARRYKPEKRLISVNEVIEKSIELYAYRMWVNNIEISTELDYDLPETMADFHQMQQVFVNIVTNAEQAMTEAHSKGKLVVKTRQIGDEIQITFTDDGPGIREDNLERIFDPFFTTKDVGKGTGLGLSICYGIVQEHGGHLYARSKLGKGATFVVEIPVVSRDAANAEPTDVVEVGQLQEERQS